MLLPDSTATKRIVTVKSQSILHAQKKVLIADLSDSGDNGLAEYLNKSGFTALETTSMEDICGRKKTLSDEFDLLILVARLPSPSTLTALRHLNRAGSPPIFVVATEGEALERVLILEMGADDLVGREANAREILARINRILSRQTEKPRPTASETAWTLRHAHRILITPSGQRISLTGRDHALLIAFSDHADGVLMENDFPIGQIRTAISRLKRKVLMDAEIVLPIENVWGQGYRFDAPLLQA